MTLISRIFSSRLFRSAAVVSVMGFGLSACQGSIDDAFPKAERPLPKRIQISMKAKGMPKGSPIMMRIFKQEAKLEIWMRKTTGRYDMVKTYDICKWSGKLGPKFKEGDRQAPEGFYWVNRRLMNPNSSYYLSFNMGFPNTYDRSNDRTGSFLMIHGACSSAGCYSMTDEQVGEIYAFARDAFNAGQKAFQIQAFPFRMTAENMFKYRNNKSIDYWRMIKQGYDHFEITRTPPQTEVCGKKYQFNVAVPGGRKLSSRAACPKLTMKKSLALSYLRVKQKEASVFEKLLAKEEGRAPLPTTSVSFSTILPGVTIVDPVRAVQSTPATDSTKKKSPNT